MNLLLLASTLLLASCSSTPLRERLLSVKHYTVKEVVIGLKCPDSYYYSYSTELCHYKAATTKVAIPIPPRSVKAPIKAIRPLKLDCNKVFKQINQCSIGSN